MFVQTNVKVVERRKRELGGEVQVVFECSIAISEVREVSCHQHTDAFTDCFRVSKLAEQRQVFSTLFL